MILFLDFDGVLHPWGCPRDEYFRYLSRLEAVLRDYGHVEIVICSDWRFTHSLTELKAKFAHDIADRVIGQTPSLILDQEDYAGLRRVEAMQYLKANKLDPNRWCALDDWPRLWEPVDGRIIRCENEFGESEERRLRGLLEAQSGASAFRKDD